MRLELVRLTADWLRRSDYGVNKYLPDVPRDNQDPEPPAIPQVLDGGVGIFDETRHDWVARKQTPPCSPALYIMAEGAIDAMGEPTPDGQIRSTVAPVSLAIRYLSEEDDLARAFANGEYTLRAVVRSLRELMKNANADARVRNSVQVQAMLDPLSYVPVVETVGQSRVSGAIIVSYEARDVAPSF